MGAQRRVYVDLGKHVADKSILDRNDRYVGKVDDLVLELSGAGEGTSDSPRVVAMVSGPLALARYLPGPFRALARALYRLVGLEHPGPIEIPWEDVAAIDVAVHADVERGELGALALADAVDRTIISRLPGAGVRP